MLFPTLLATVVAPALAQAPKPPGLKVEASAPFSWYLVPSDVVGFKDAPQGFQVTYDGAFNNGFGELDLEAGSPLTAVNQRVKTLYKDYYPIIEYSFDRGGARYDVESFGAPLDLDPREDLIAFVRITISNPGTKPVNAGLRAAYGPRGDFGRAEMPCRHWYQAKFMDSSAFKQGENPEAADGEVSKGGHLLFFYSGAPQVDASNSSVSYSMQLKPHQSTMIDLRIPFVPLKTSLADSVKSMAYDDYFKRVVSFWDGIFAKASDFELNDPKVQDAVRANLAYDLIARDVDEDGKHFTQTVNKFQYHGFFMRDTSFIAHTYDLLNLHKIAGETVDHYLVRDASGKLSLRRESPDDWGQSLWAVGAHFKATDDLAFAKEVHPTISAHLDDFVKETSSDPRGLWPVAGPYDNELIDGHYTSHNLWALLGLQEAENLCRAVGDTANADRAHRLYVAFRKHFVAELSKLTSKDGGYIPPGMDDPLAGHDWENASGGVYPFRVFKPFNPWVTATVNMEREYKYREGIMTWGPNAYKGKVAAENGAAYDPLFLHDYDTFQVTEALLARDEQRKVIEDLYSTLVHTSSTHAGFETSIRPWGDRDPGGNFPPHGWFAARYNELVRNMLLREDGTTLHLASALSPVWIEPGKTLKVERGASDFGNIGYSIASAKSGATVEIHSTWRVAPKQLLFHIPWFVQARSATVDGRSVAIKDSAVAMPPNAKLLVLKWRWMGQPGLTYQRAVQLWLHKAYEPEPNEDMDHLFPTPTRPALATPDTLFVGSYLVKLVSRSGEGTIHYTTDGSMPTVKSPKYKKPFAVTKDTTVRAFEIWPDGRSGEPMMVRIRKAVYQSSVPVPNPRAGLEYAYYEGDFPKMPDFGSLTPAHTGEMLRGDLDETQHRPEKFALRITGYVNVPKDGIYTFVTGSDDGSKLWIGDKLVVDNDGPHAYSEVQGEIALKKGPHPVRITYFDSGGATYLRLFWSGPGFARRGLDPAALEH